MLHYLRTGRSACVRQALAGMKLDSYMALFDSDQIDAKASGVEGASAAGIQS
jgi:hypothetical protein